MSQAHPLRVERDGVTPEALDAQCQAILDRLEAAGEPLTKEALTCELGWPLDAWQDYTRPEAAEGERAPWRRALKRAEARIARWWVSRLAGNNVVGAIYYTKAALGYRDQDPRQPDVLIAGGTGDEVRAAFADVLAGARPAKDSSSVDKH